MNGYQLTETELFEIKIEIGINKLTATELVEVEVKIILRCWY
jgi:hypothetical protein